MKVRQSQLCFWICVGYYKAVILPDNIFSKLNPAKLSGLPRNSTHYFRSPRSGSRDKGNPNINLNKKQTISMAGNGVDELTSKSKCGLTAKVGRRVRALPELMHLYFVLEPAGHYFDHWRGEVSWWWLPVLVLAWGLPCVSLLGFPQRSALHSDRLSLSQIMCDTTSSQCSLYSSLPWKYISSHVRILELSTLFYT